MIESLRTLSLASVSVAVGLAVTPALAGSPYGNRPADTIAKNERLAAAGVPNVPDLQGCEKWCLHDINPCDPPLFKRTDGRCEEP